MTGLLPARAPVRPAFDSLALFTFFWAVGVLTHQGYHARYDGTWHNTLLIVAAFAALVRPSSVLRLAVLAAASVIAVAVDMPEVYNHWLLVGLANGMILVVLATRPGRGRHDASGRTALYHAIAPPLRLMLLGTYAFAFLAKLNPDFLSLRLSCAAETYPRLARRLTILPLGAWARESAIWFTLVMEAAIPALLAIRRTRAVGVLAALAFHATMGLAAYYDFSAAVAGFLVLFLPDDTPARLNALAERYSWMRNMAAAGTRFARAPWSLPLLLASAYLVYNNIRSIDTPFLFSMRLWIVFTIGAFTVLALALADAGRLAPQHGAPLTVTTRLWMFGVLALLLETQSPHPAYSLAVAALVTLVIPRQAAAELSGSIARFPSLAKTLDTMQAAARSPIGVLALLAAGYWLMSETRRSDSSAYFVLLGLATWTLGALLFRIFKATAAAPSASHLRLRRAAYVLGPAIVLLNGLSPYIGLKTEHSFTMFSNLATEGDRWNHFFVPPSVQVVPLQDDLVQIVASSDRTFRGWARDRTSLVWVHFRILARQRPDASVVYERGGQRYEVPRIGDDPVLSQDPGWLAVKLADFRLVTERNVCSH